MHNATIDLDRSTEALEALSPEVRQSIHLVYSSGFTTGQVSDLLGVTVEVVEQRLCDGLAAITR